MQRSHDRDFNVQIGKHIGTSPPDIHVIRVVYHMHHIYIVGMNMSGHYRHSPEIVALFRTFRSRPQAYPPHDLCNNWLKRVYTNYIVSVVGLFR